jgi:maltooligosyltrehalose synthase
VLERGELKVRFEGGAFYLNYYEHEWPIAPGTYRHVLQIALSLSSRTATKIFTLSSRAS